MSRSWRKIKYVLGHTKKHHKERLNKRTRQLNKQRINKGQDPLIRDEIGRVEKNFFLIAEHDKEYRDKMIRK